VETAAWDIGNEVEDLTADRSSINAVRKAEEVRCGGRMCNPPSTGYSSSDGSVAGCWALISLQLGTVQ